MIHLNRYLLFATPIGVVPVSFSHYLIAAACLTLTSVVMANTTIPLRMTVETGIGEPAGSVVITETPYGLLFTPDLHGLTPGIHGFHVHEHPSCQQQGMAAGGHFDPKHTEKHLGPYNNQGHLGDLPVLYVDAEGKSSTPVLAVRLHHVNEIRHHALMVHFAGDNYADMPEKLGGGGARMACGIIT